MQPSFRPVSSQIRQIFLSFSPYTFSHRHYCNIYDRLPAYQIHTPPLRHFRIERIQFTVSFSRLYRASDKSGFPLMPVGVSERAFQGVTLSFHSSKYQFSWLFKPQGFWNQCRIFSIRNVSHSGIHPYSTAWTCAALDWPWPCSRLGLARLTYLTF